MRQMMECRVSAGKTVKQVLQNDYLMSRGLISSLKKQADGIMVNGERKHVTYTLREGDRLFVTFSETGSINIEPVFIPIEVLFEDEYVLAVNKPDHMPVHISHDHIRDTLSNAVLYYLNKDGEDYMFHVATRLDRNTSGVVLIAKNAYMHDMLSRQLRSKSIYKEYTAIVCSIPQKNEGTIVAPIARESNSIIKRCVREDGDFAKTVYKTTASNGSFSVIKLMPETGRTHQLRVHMAYIGCPIVGDDLYGAEPIPENRQLLHCRDIQFMHPITKNIINITAPLPECFERYINIIKHGGSDIKDIK